MVCTHASVSTRSLGLILNLLGEVVRVDVNVCVQSDHTLMDGPRDAVNFFLTERCWDLGWFTAALY